MVSALVVAALAVVWHPEGARSSLSWRFALYWLRMPSSSDGKLVVAEKSGGRWWAGAADKSREVREVAEKSDGKWWADEADKSEGMSMAVKSDGKNGGIDINGKGLRSLRDGGNVWAWESSWDQCRCGGGGSKWAWKSSGDQGYRGGSMGDEACEAVKSSELVGDIFGWILWLRRHEGGAVAKSFGGECGVSLWAEKSALVRKKQKEKEKAKEKRKELAAKSGKVSVLTSGSPSEVAPIGLSGIGGLASSV